MVTSKPLEISNRNFLPATKNFLRKIFMLKTHPSLTSEHAQRTLFETYFTAHLFAIFNCTFSFPSQRQAVALKLSIFTFHWLLLHVQIHKRFLYSFFFIIFNLSLLLSVWVCSSALENDKLTTRSRDCIYKR